MLEDSYFYRKLEQNHIINECVKTFITLCDLFEQWKIEGIFNLLQYLILNLLS